MTASLHKPSSPILSEYIDYFLFLENTEGHGFYKTFPNTNICLALYKTNSVHWNRIENRCEVVTNTHTGITSKLFAFHRKPFSVAYNGPVEQVCILFKMGAIPSFTNTPVHQLDADNDPATQLLGKNSIPFLQQLFSYTGNQQKAEALNSYLLKKLVLPSTAQQRYLHALEQLKNNCPHEKNIVGFLSKELDINPSTLYRRFMALFGQSALDIYKTIRFRHTLYDMLSRRQSLCQTAYESNFFDQSHFIKDIRQFTGESPKALLRNIAEVKDTLYWIKQ